MDCKNFDTLDDKCKGCLSGGTMADIELKKCPFCGSNTKFVRRIEESYGDVRIGGVEVVCTGCRRTHKHWTSVMYPR